MGILNFDLFQKSKVTKVKTRLKIVPIVSYLCGNSCFEADVQRMHTLEAVKVGVT